MKVWRTNLTSAWDVHHGGEGNGEPGGLINLLSTLSKFLEGVTFLVPGYTEERHLHGDDLRRRSSVGTHVDLLH